MQFLNFAALSIALIMLPTSVNWTAPAIAAESQSAATATPEASTVEVHFTGIQLPTGTVMLALFDSEAAYSGDGAPVHTSFAPVQDGTATLTITGLASGQYAIKAFHDVDGDGKMGANPFGMPTEPFAFSNNAQGKMGPAVWADAKFDVAPGTTVQTITIQ